MKDSQLFYDFKAPFLIKSNPANTRYPQDTIIISSDSLTVSLGYLVFAGKFLSTDVHTMTRDLYVFLLVQIFHIMQTLFLLF